MKFFDYKKNKQLASAQIARRRLEFVEQNGKRGEEGEENRKKRHHKRRRVAAVACCRYPCEFFFALLFVSPTRWLRRWLLQPRSHRDAHRYSV